MVTNNATRINANTMIPIKPNFKTSGKLNISHRPYTAIVIPLDKIAFYTRTLFVLLKLFFAHVRMFVIIAGISLINISSEVKREIPRLLSGL